MELKFKKLKPEAIIPNYAHDDDMGIDLFSCEDHTLMPGEKYGFYIGIASEIQKGYGILVADKSKIGDNTIKVYGGVIDGGYRGEWKIILVNSGKVPYEIKKGDKIAQGLHLKVQHPRIIEVEELSDTERGAGGFGSTGR